MTTDLGTVLSQKKELDVCADYLKEARAKLISHREKLDSIWSAAEIRMIDDVIDRINLRLSRLADELNDIGTDMLKTCQQIQEQERIAEQKSLEEQKRLEKQRRLEEQKSLEEAKRLTEQKSLEKALSSLRKLIKL